MKSHYFLQDSLILKKNCLFLVKLTSMHNNQKIQIHSIRMICAVNKLILFLVFKIYARDKFNDD